MELCTLSMLWLEQPKKGWNNQKRVGTTIKKWLEHPKKRMEHPKKGWNIHRKSGWNIQKKGWNNHKKVGTTSKICAIFSLNNQLDKSFFL